jgi:hypothetical protein
MIVPTTIQGKRDFYALHANLWTPSPSTIGLTAPQVAQLGTLADVLTDALTNQVTAHNAAKMATQAVHDAVDALDEYGQGCLNAIRSKVQTTGDNAIYTVAGLPQPPTPSSAGLPPTPTNVSAFIDTDGNVQISWSGSRAYGTSWTIARQLNGETTWTLLGASAKRTFKDTTVPMGTTTAQYKVFAQRSAGTSAGSEPGAVVFGVAQAA